MRSLPVKITALLIVMLFFVPIAATAEKKYLERYTNDPSEWVRPDAIPHPADNPSTPEKIVLGKEAMLVILGM